MEFEMIVSTVDIGRQFRKAAERKNSVTLDVRRLAYSSNTGDAPRVFVPQPVSAATRIIQNDDPHCFVCGRHTDHFGEHDDLVDAGKAVYYDDGSVHLA
jgi:hypothetical protein